MVKLNKIIECLKKPKFYKYYFNGVAPLFELTPLIKELKDINTLIDVGSNKGQFSAILRNFYPQVSIHSFEPQIDELNIQKKLLGSSNINYYAFALGDENKNMLFNITKRKDSSSLLDPLLKNNKIYSENKKINVPVKKLDTVLDINELIKPILIKLDVQGFELKALIGAQSVLDNVDYIISEISFLDVYKNQVNADDLIKYLKSKNFDIHKRTNLTKLNGNNFQEDVLFVKKQ